MKTQVEVNEIQINEEKYTPARREWYTRIKDADVFGKDPRVVVVFRANGKETIKVVPPDALNEVAYMYELVYTISGFSRDNIRVVNPVMHVWGKDGWDPSEIDVPTTFENQYSEALKELSEQEKIRARLLEELATIDRRIGRQNRLLSQLKSLADRDRAARAVRLTKRNKQALQRARKSNNRNHK